MYRPLFPFLLLLVAVPGFVPGDSGAQQTPTADEAGVRFHFETGSPPWAGERIVLPPGFARDLGWSGVEEIRFAPGMFGPGEPDFFSYVLAFVLEPGADLSAEGLRKELLTYYGGLSKAVMGSAGMEVDTDGFSVKVEKGEGEMLRPPASAPGATAWRAVLEWVEPFATKREQVLHLEVHTWKHGEYPVVLSCVSPVDPESAAEPWPTLRAIRGTFRLE